jgi:hypothetical protein
MFANSCQVCASAGFHETIPVAPEAHQLHIIQKKNQEPRKKIPEM